VNLVGCTIGILVAVLSKIGGGGYKKRRSRYSVLICIYHVRKWGHAVAQLVEALRYKPEGRGFYSRRCL